jgi:hypothetical protein
MQWAWFYQNIIGWLLILRLAGGLPFRLRRLPLF